MLEVRFRGSGGHGVVVAGKLLANAAAKSGYICQSLASYGGLRRGGTVESYVRIDDKPILVHSKIYEADYLVLMDEIYVHDSDILSSIKTGGQILINSVGRPIDLPTLPRTHIKTVDASRIAAEIHLIMASGTPVINVTMLGAVIGLIGVIPFDRLSQAIREGAISYLKRQYKTVSLVAIFLFLIKIRAYGSL